MKNIITIQHTQSVHHTNGMVGSWTDWELTETGLKKCIDIKDGISYNNSNKVRKLIWVC